MILSPEGFTVHWIILTILSFYGMKRKDGRVTLTTNRGVAFSASSASFTVAYQRHLFHNRTRHTLAFPLSAPGGATPGAFIFIILLSVTMNYIACRRRAIPKPIHRQSARPGTLALFPGNQGGAHAPPFTITLPFPAWRLPPPSGAWRPTHPGRGQAYKPGSCRTPAHFPWQSTRRGCSSSPPAPNLPFSECGP